MKKGLFLIVIAGVLWGTSCIFVNFFAPYGFSSSQMTALRMTAAFLFMLAYCLLFDRKALRLRAGDLVFTVICGLTLYGTAAFYFEAMQLTSVSTAVVLMYTAPVPVMLISVLFFGERFSLLKGVTVVLMLTGCVLVAGIIGDFKPDALGVTMGLLSAAAYALYNVFNKVEARRGIAPVTSTLYTFLFAALCALLVCRPQELPGLIAQRPAAITPMIAALALVTCLLPYLLYSVSLKTLPVGIASAMSIIEPMTGALLGLLLYKDQLTVSTGIGIVLVVGAVFLIGISEPAAKKEALPANAD